MEWRETPSDDRDIRREYETGRSKLDGKQAHILRWPIEEVLKLPLEKKKQWLDTVERSREAFHSKQSVERRRYDHERAVMKRFLNQE